MVFVIKLTPAHTGMALALQVFSAPRLGRPRFTILRRSCFDWVLILQTSLQLSSVVTEADLSQGSPQMFVCKLAPHCTGLDVDHSRRHARPVPTEWLQTAHGMTRDHATYQAEPVGIVAAFLQQCQHEHLCSSLAASSHLPPRGVRVRGYATSFAAITGSCYCTRPPRHLVGQESG